jgi:phosphoenolpyruvate synthase/pyruvate phosphate dikinase
MNIKECLLPLTPGLPLNSIGNKAHSLLFLQKHHCRIPRTHIVPAEVMISYLESGASVLDSLRRKIGELPDGPYAVRSSTSSEDMESHSFAGQFQSFTDVRGEQEILRAILAVWDSAGSVAGSEYFSRITKPAHQVRCAVILQEMVESRLAGVSFSKNPVNDLNEVIVEAVEGPGEDLVQKGLTPYRWRIRGDNNLEGPVEYRHYGVIKKIAADTARLRKLYGKHVDIEWAFDGDDLYYLQIRSIVGKNRLPVYSSKMAREMLPGQIKPLVWSINIPLVNGTWLRILSARGPHQIVLLPNLHQHVDPG